MFSMRYPNGLKKAITLSYDDGLVTDVKMLEILNKYGIKCTFNVNYGFLNEDDFVYPEIKSENMWTRLRKSHAVELFKNSGHEVAAHGFVHKSLGGCTVPEAMHDILHDRECLEKLFGTVVRGMAYANGSYDGRCAEYLPKCDICYSRTVDRTGKFDFPENWIYLHPTCHHDNPKLMELLDSFLNEDFGDCKMFYLWGHSSEFEVNNNWDVLEKFCAVAGNRDDVWYATNIEIYDYKKAYDSLIYTVDGLTVYNPSGIDVWLNVNGESKVAKSGVVTNLV